MQNFWFKKNPSFYNYSEFFQYIKNNNKNKALDTLYLSNNIAESLHSKFNYYLPKAKTTPKSFYYAMEKILINITIPKDKIIRYDIITRTLLKIIKEEKLNEQCKWIEYDIYNKYFQVTLNENNIQYENSNKLYNLINIINDLDIEEDNKKFINENSENENSIANINNEILMNEEEFNEDNSLLNNSINSGNSDMNLEDENKLIIDSQNQETNNIDNLINIIEKVEIKENHENIKNKEEIINELHPPLMTRLKNNLKDKKYSNTLISSNNSNNNKISNFKAKKRKSDIEDEDATNIKNNLCEKQKKNPFVKNKNIVHILNLLDLDID